MKQFAIIIFVLIFALTGNSQSPDILQKQIACNCISFTNRNLPTQDSIILQDLYYDGQDTEDLDGFVSVSVLTESQIHFQYSKSRRFVAVYPSQQILQVSELLLDLPPPMLSF